MTEVNNLIIADQYGRELGVSDHFKKAPAPKLGNKFGAWAGRDITFLQMPGGAVLQFDLSQLTLADFRMMKEHYQLSNSLNLIMFMLSQVDWHIEVDGERQTKVGNKVDNILRPVWFRLVRAWSQCLWAGYSPIVIDWENIVDDRTVGIAKFKDLPPEECKVHWNEVKGYAPPGHAKPKFYEYGGIDVWGQSWPIPPENTVWASLFMENGDYYGRKLLKPAFPSWFFSMLIHLFANRYYERFGEPLPIGRAAFDAEFTVGDSIVNGREVMENLLQAIRSRAVAVLPSDRDPDKGEYDFDIEYLESQMRGADFERYLTRLDEEMSMSLFTPILLMRTGDVGAYNLGVSHLSTWLWVLNSFAQDWKDYIDRYIVTRIRDYNFGPNAGRVEWVPRTLGKDNQEMVRGALGQLIADNKIAIDTEDLGYALGLKITKLSDVKIVPKDPNVEMQVKAQQEQAAADRASQEKTAKITAKATAAKTRDTRVARDRAKTAKQRVGRGAAKP